MRVSRRSVFWLNFSVAIDRSYTFCTLGKKWIYVKIILKLYMDIYQNRLKVEIEARRTIKIHHIPYIYPAAGSGKCGGPMEWNPSKPPYCAYYDGARREKMHPCMDNGVGIDTEKAFETSDRKSTVKTVEATEMWKRGRLQDLASGEGYGQNRLVQNLWKWYLHFL